MEAHPNHEEDDSKRWSEIALGLSRLNLAGEYAREFSKKFSRYLGPQDRMEMAGLCAKFDYLYWKYWEKLIKKIRGI